MSQSIHGKRYQGKAEKNDNFLNFLLCCAIVPPVV